MGYPCPAEGCPGTRIDGRCVHCEVWEIRLQCEPWTYPHVNIKPLPPDSVRFAASRQVSDTRVHAPEGVSLTTTAPRGTSGMGPPAPQGAGVLFPASREVSDTRVHAPEGVSLTTTVPIGTSGMRQEAPVGAIHVSCELQRTLSLADHAIEVACSVNVSRIDKQAMRLRV